MQPLDVRRSHSCNNLLEQSSGGSNIYDDVDASYGQSRYMKNQIYLQKNGAVPDQNTNQWVSHYKAKDDKVTLKKEMYHLSREQLVDFLDSSHSPASLNRPNCGQTLHQGKHNVIASSSCWFCWFIFNFLVVCCIVFLMLHTMYPQALTSFNLSDDAQECLREVNIVKGHAKNILDYINKLHKLQRTLCDDAQQKSNYVYFRNNYSRECIYFLKSVRPIIMSLYQK